MIRAGKLRKRVEIQEPVVTRGSTGEKIDTWQTVATRNVRVREEKRAIGGESFHADYQERAVTSYQIAMRWERRLSRMTPLWRIKDGDQIYEIEAVTNVEDRNREYLIRAVLEY